MGRAKYQDQQRLLTVNQSPNYTDPRRIRITRAESASIVAAHNEHPPPCDQQLFFSGAYEFGHRALPAHLVAGLRGAAADIDGAGITVLENLPLGTDADTPQSDDEYFSRSTRDQLTERLLAAVGEHLGSTFAYANERQGRLICNVVPTAAARDIQSSSGSSLVLPLHTEDIHQLPYTPDLVVLFCLREEAGEEAHTLVLDTRTVVKTLSERLDSLLRQPLFVTEPPPIYAAAANRRAQPVPVLYGNSERAVLRIELNDTRGVSPDAESALEEVKAMCSAAPGLVHLRLRPGEMVILDNHKVLHGRGSFASSYGPRSRWLQRVKVKSGTLWPWRDLLSGPRLVDL